jgi:hypothetical protein
VRRPSHRRLRRTELFREGFYPSAVRRLLDQPQHLVEDEPVGVRIDDRPHPRAVLDRQLELNRTTPLTDLHDEVRPPLLSPALVADLDAPPLAVIVMSLPALALGPQHGAGVGGRDLDLGGKPDDEQLVPDVDVRPRRLRRGNSTVAAPRAVSQTTRAWNTLSRRKSTSPSRMNRASREFTRRSLTPNRTLSSLAVTNRNRPIHRSIS